jgi:hypothetical protein
MTEQWLRFGVSDGYSRWSATWKLWVTSDQGKIQVCLGSGFLKGYLLTSTDAPGRWRVTYASPVVPTPDHSAHARQGATEFVDLSTRPRSVEGRTCVFRILIPSSSVNLPRIAGRYRYVSWIPRPVTGRAVEAAIIVTENRSNMPRWPTRAMVGFAMLGSLELMSGERVSVFYRSVDGSTLAARPHDDGWFQPGGSRDPGRNLAVGSGADGAVVIHDLIADAGSGAA